MLKALRWLFESVLWDVQRYDSGDDFVARYDGEGPACLLLDLVMPGMNGLALQRTLVERAWTLPVIFLSGQAKIPDAVQALQGGAIDFIEKPFSDDVLPERVRLALVNDGTRRQEATSRAMRLRQLAGLTRREREVASRVVDGLPNRSSR